MWASSSSPGAAGSTTTECAFDCVRAAPPPRTAVGRGVAEALEEASMSDTLKAYKPKADAL
ncbi:hypothetical protein GCM10009830_41110 [Glycomyces endophyticus]|uniref:Uncharacterized protein n=1 Tax=Glycomyces endophyticus TaxID=480996 RepID=A0ABN2HLE0_9ACTN